MVRNRRLQGTQDSMPPSARKPSPLSSISSDIFRYLSSPITHFDKFIEKSVHTKILAPTEIFFNKTEYPDEAVIKILSISIWLYY